MSRICIFSYRKAKNIYFNTYSGNIWEKNNHQLSVVKGIHSLHNYWKIKQVSMFQDLQDTQVKTTYAKTPNTHTE